jgi:hypothetical protein
MKNPQQYIEQHFSEELKLIIFLSQDQLKDDVPDLKNLDWDVFVQLCLKHRLVSHILNHAEFLAENIPVPVYEKLIEHRLEHSKLSLNYTVHAIRIHQKFKENNLQHLFFKGPLLSLELYKDIGYRNFGDIDILVKREDAEQAREIIEDLDFKCIYPKIKLTKKQQKANYTISHHYHFVHPKQRIDVELHWNITNPVSYYGKASSEIISNKNELDVSTYKLPYISVTDNLVYQAAHGSVHQFYRLFWLKDFSVLIDKTKLEIIERAWQLSKKLKLERSFQLACVLSHLIYGSKLPAINFSDNVGKNLLWIPIKSIEKTELKQKGIVGKFKYVLYRLRLKPSFKYYFDVIYRLRTHLSDWELIRIPDKLFFLYFLLRPFLLLYHHFFEKRKS